MSNKFNSLQKEIEDLKEEIGVLNEQRRQSLNQIHLLEKEVVGLKKEIRDRDDTLGDKEKRIFELKKRNQVIILMMKLVMVYRNWKSLNLY